MYLTEPEEQVFITPPYLVIEIMSPEDRWSRMMRKLQDYVAMGCENVWIFDPAERCCYRYEAAASIEQHEEISTADGRLQILLSDVW